MSASSDFYLTFVRREKASQNNTCSFFFERKGLDFIAGQYIRMDLENIIPDERGSFRYFTIASSPTEKEIMITTRTIKSAFKMSLLQFSKGQKILCSGPYGNFVLREKDTRHRVFLAGGMGITPFRSMSICVRDENLPIPITILASYSSINEILFYDELKIIEKTNSRFSYNVIISEPHSSSEWSGETGKIDEMKIKKYIANTHDAYYYIVGPSLMVSTTIALIKQMGVPTGNIKTENFPGY